MHGDAMVERDATGWAPGHGGGTAAMSIVDRQPIDWRTVDRTLRAIRQRRAALDAEEARWLREAEALQIWRPLGMVSALDYLERALGYAPRTAQDRLRVARALGDLPRLTEALAADQLSFSAVRELTRVATPATEASWVAAAAGKNLRQIEELVTDHRPGDRPDDPPDPAARTHVVRFELSAETFALLRQARGVLDDEHGTNLADDAFVAALCGAALGDAPVAEPSGRARFQIAMTVCARCHQGWQEGAGAQVAVDAAAVERALCDAQHIGSLDGPEPERAHQDIPPSTVRFVWRRDGGRCRVDGCRSARGLEVHHLVHRAEGGSHEASNLILACSCHQAHHAGTLTISGTVDRLVVHRAGEPRMHMVRPGATVGAHVGAGEPRGVVDGMASPARTPQAPRIAVTGEQADASQRCELVDSTELPASRPHATSIAPMAAHVGVDVDEAFMGASMPALTRSKLQQAMLRTQAKAAHTGLGWTPAIAQAAVAAAVVVEGPQVTLERLIFASLRQCPAPRA